MLKTLSSATMVPSTPSKAEDHQQASLDDSWTPVANQRRRRSESDPTSAGGSVTKSKSARKNERRRQRKRREQQASGLSSRTTTPRKERSKSGGDGSGSEDAEEDEKEEDGDDDEGAGALSRALAASSLASGRSSGRIDPRDVDVLKKRLRGVKKKLAAAEALSTIPPSDLDEGQKAKLSRLPSLEAEASELESALIAIRTAEDEADRVAADLAERSARVRMEEWAALENGAVVDGFDSEFACPICVGPLETPVEAKPCRHVFCRACLEECVRSSSMTSGGDPESCVCPLCRSCLFDPTTLRIKADAAEVVRRKMKKRKCRCRCGTELALSGLRRHLRVCEDGAPNLFGDDERKNFGHEFEQPRLDEKKVNAFLKKRGLLGGGKKKGGGRRSRSGSVSDANHQQQQQQRHQDAVPQGYDEDAEIQAAILLSLGMS